MSKKNIIAPFVEAGITDKETNIFFIFNHLAITCKSWVSMSNKICMSRVLKQHCKDKFNFFLPVFILMSSKLLISTCIILAFPGIIIIRSLARV